jgi:hypothetical protein
MSLEYPIATKRLLTATKRLLYCYKKVAIETLNIMLYDTFN